MRRSRRIRRGRKQIEVQGQGGEVDQGGEAEEEEEALGAAEEEAAGGASKGLAWIGFQNVT